MDAPFVTSATVELYCGCIVRVCNCPKQDIQGLAHCLLAQELRGRIAMMSEKDAKKRALLTERYLLHIGEAKTV